MTPFLHCKKAELPGGWGQPTIRASVSTAPTGGLLISLPRNISFSTTEPVDVVFFDPVMGLARCRCRLSAPVPEKDTCVYRCEVLDFVSQDQRRADLKVALNVPVEVNFGGTVWDAEVQNLSAGGVLLVSTLHAKQGDVLNFRFDQTDSPINLSAQVLRVGLRPPKKGKLYYGYGCRFLDLQPQDESLLRGYIFREERRMYHATE